MKLITLLILALFLNSCQSIYSYEAEPLRAMCYDQNRQIIFNSEKFSWDQCAFDLHERQIRDRLR